MKGNIFPGLQTQSHHHARFWNYICQRNVRSRLLNDSKYNFNFLSHPLMCEQNHIGYQEPEEAVNWKLLPMFMMPKGRQRGKDKTQQWGDIAQDAS